MGRQVYLGLAAALLVGCSESESIEERIAGSEKIPYVLNEGERIWYCGVNEGIRSGLALHSYVDSVRAASGIADLTRIPVGDTIHVPNLDRQQERNRQAVDCKNYK